MGNLDRFRYQNVPDIDSNHESDEAGPPEMEHIKHEVTVNPAERVKEYLKANHQKVFFSSIIDQQNFGYKQFVLELELNLNFLKGLDHSINLKNICVDILQEFTKSKILPETVHVMITPFGLDLDPITKLNDLFPIPNPDPVFSKIECTIMEQAQKSFHVLAKLIKCSNSECRDKSIIYMVQNSFHDILNNWNNGFSTDFHEVSLFKRSVNTGNLLGLTHQNELHKVDLYCYSCGSDLVEQILDRLTITKHSYKVLLRESQIPITVVFHTNRDIDLQVGDRKFLIVKPRSKYEYQKVCTFNPVVTGISVYDYEEVEIDHTSSNTDEDQRLISHFSDLPPFQLSQELVSIFGSGMLDSTIWRKLRLVILLSLANLRDDPIHTMLVADGYNPLLMRFLNMLMELGGTRMKTWNPNFYPKVDLNKITFHQNSTKNQFVMIPLDLDIVSKRQLNLQKWTLPSFQKISQEHLRFDWNCSLLAVTEYSIPEDYRFKKRIKIHQENATHFDLVLNLKSQNAKPSIDEAQSFSILLTDPILMHKSFFIYWFKSIANLSTPHFPTSLQKMISAYITNLRHHSDISYSIDKLVSTIRKLSLAHARLTRSSKVRREDCIVAINLVEESLALVYDTSLFGFKSYDQDLENLHIGGGDDSVKNAVLGLEELMVRVQDLCEEDRYLIDVT